MAGALAEENEHDPEHQRERRALELFTFTVVREVHPTLLRPSLHAHSKGWKSILTDRAVQAFVELDAEGPRFISEGREAAFGQKWRRQQRQEGQSVLPQQLGVQFQPLARWRSRVRAEQTEATALGKDSEASAVGFTVFQEKTLWGAPVPVHSGEVASGGFGVNHRDRSAVVPSEMPPVGELLESVAELGEQSAPRIAWSDFSELLGGGGPAGRVALEAVLKSVPREETIEGQAVAPDSCQVIGEATYSVECRECRHVLE